MTRFVVIGGDAAGMSAAAQATRGVEAVELVVFERGQFTSYAACGLPYFVGGLVGDADRLVARSPEEHRRRGVDVRTGHEVVAIHPAEQVVEVRVALGDPLPLVAETVHDLTPGWVSAALSGPDGEVGVRAVATERVGTGQMGTAYRLTIAYDEGSQGPATLVAKLAAEDPAARMTVAPSYRKEVGFYAHIAATVAVRAPRCWAAGISEDGSAFSLLLEDLAPAAPGRRRGSRWVPMPTSRVAWWGSTSRARRPSSPA